MMSGVVFDKSVYVANKLALLNEKSTSKYTHDLTVILPVDNLNELEAYSEILPIMPDSMKIIKVDISFATNVEGNPEDIKMHTKSLCKCLNSLKGKTTNHTIVIHEKRNHLQELITSKNHEERAKLANEFLKNVLPELAKTRSITKIEVNNMPDTYYTDVSLFSEIGAALKGSNVKTINLDFIEIYQAHPSIDKSIKFLLDLASNLQKNDSGIKAIALNYNHISQKKEYRDKVINELQKGMPAEIKLQLNNKPIKDVVTTLLSQVQSDISNETLIFHHIELPEQYKSERELFVGLIKELDKENTAINFFTSALLMAAEIPGYYKDESDEKYYIDRMGAAIFRFVKALGCCDKIDDKMTLAIKAQLTMINSYLNDKDICIGVSEDYGRLLQYLDRVCATVGAEIKQAQPFKQHAYANSDIFPDGEIPEFKNYTYNKPSKPRYI